MKRNFHSFYVQRVYQSKHVFPYQKQWAGTVPQYALLIQISE